MMTSLIIIECLKKHKNYWQHPYYLCVTTVNKSILGFCVWCFDNSPSPSEKSLPLKKIHCSFYTRHVERGGGRGGSCPPDFGRSEGAAGSGGAPHYYVPPRFLDFGPCLQYVSVSQFFIRIFIKCLKDWYEIACIRRYVICSGRFFEKSCQIATAQSQITSYSIALNYLPNNGVMHHI